MHLSLIMQPSLMAISANCNPFTATHALVQTRRAVNTGHFFLLLNSNRGCYCSAGLDMWPQHKLWVEACRHHYSPRAGWDYR